MKRTISIVMVIVMLILTSCGNSQKVSNYNNSLELVTHIDGIMGNTIAANENGWYQIYDNVNGYANIMYTDFQTKTTHFLCSRPECLHNDDSCNSFVKNKYGGNMLFLSEDSLYLLHHSISSNFTPEINEFSYIEKMDLSGNNKWLRGYSYICTKQCSYVYHPS